MRNTVASLCLTLLLGCQFQTGPKADLVLRRGKFVTLTAERPVAEALAISGGRIDAVGSDAEISRYIGPETEVIDLAGALAVPGLIDSHAHFLDMGLAQMTVDVVGTKSVSEIAARVREAARQAPEETWIQGHGWDQNDWRDASFPTHESLDRVAPNHPVYLVRIDGHAGWANSKAMELAGIDAETPDPEGGEVLRDEEGNPTGVFIDRAAELITDRIPPPTESRLWEAFQRAQQMCLAEGITTLHDAGAGENSIGLYRKALEQGELRMRLYVMLSASEEGLLGRYFSHRPEIGPRLTIRAVKVVADGALGSRGAALLEDYADRPDWRGLMIVPEEEIYRLSTRALSAGYQMAVHAIGDRANRQVLDAYQRAFEDRPQGNSPRFRIEHAQILDQVDIPRLAQLGVIASMQGVHATSDMPWVEARVGEERAEEGAYAWQSLLRSGAKIANGSDAPVESVSVLEGFYATITRQNQAGKPEGGWLPEERMSREQALRSYTLDAAYAAFEEREKGSLEPGKLADITVLSKDIMTIEPHEILETEVVFTMIGGKIVYQKMPATSSRVTQ